jgi:hypothetical protein
VELEPDPVELRNPVAVPETVDDLVPDPLKPEAATFTPKVIRSIRDGVAVDETVPPFQLVRTESSR